MVLRGFNVMWKGNMFEIFFYVVIVQFLDNTIYAGLYVQTDSLSLYFEHFLQAV